jgi:4-amino-4-deoxy-L-arabinose transferase-like glycosyltransferase
MLTVAMLIKGPIVYAFLLPSIGVFEWWRRRHAVVAGVGDPGNSHTVQLRQSAWPGWWPWVASLVVFLLWVIGGILFQPGFFEEVVMREFVGRFGETIHRPQPLYFYLPHLLHKFAPWSVLMIAIALVELHSRKWRWRAALRDMSPEAFWLLCWSLGGLIVMSLIPSKRVDRIFPVVPPLCLLLAAQIAKWSSCSHGSVSRLSASPDSDLTGHRPVATANKKTRIGVYRWSALALILAILFTGSYTILKVVTGYRHHRDGLAIFGRDVRREAETHHWRYEVVSAKDEGLLLYLQRTHFIEPDHAITEWNRGNLDALVASTEKAPALMRSLQNAVLSQSKSGERREAQGKDYVLITH